MDGVGAQVDGVSGVDEVVEADAALGGKVPDAGIGVGTVVRDVVRWATEGRVFVIGPEQASGGLGPGYPFLAMDEVPTEDDGGEGDA